MDLKALTGPWRGRRRPDGRKPSKSRPAWMMPLWPGRGGQGTGFASRVVLPLHRLSKAVWTDQTRGRMDEWKERLDRIRALPPMRVTVQDAGKLLKVAEIVLRNSRARQDGSAGFRELDRKLEESIVALHAALGRDRPRRRGGLVGPDGHERGRPVGPASVARGVAMVRAANRVVQAATVMLQFVNCRDMKVSVSSHGERTRIVVEGPGDGGAGDGPVVPKERLRRISGVSCPYVIDEKANTIMHKSGGRDGRPSRTYRIPSGAASAAVNALVKGMVDGIMAGSEDWTAPFSGADAKALCRETRLDNLAFFNDCVERTPLKGKGNRQYANSARLRR